MYIELSVQSVELVLNLRLESDFPDILALSKF